MCNTDLRLIFYSNDFCSAYSFHTSFVDFIKCIYASFIDILYLFYNYLLSILDVTDKSPNLTNRHYP